MSDKMADTAVSGRTGSSFSSSSSSSTTTTIITAYVHTVAPAKQRQPLHSCHLSFTLRQV